MNRILLVEDDPDIQFFFKESLKYHFEVVGTAITGEEAIDAANTLKPELVLMDVILKGNMTGIQAAKTIMESNKIPVVFVTANNDIERIKQAHLEIPYAFVLKPVDFKALKNEIKKLLNKDY